ncbi:lipopolysaccharide heptosyltransferase II [Ktedonosporobacter rubrisoli]|uniref:lipopolysaccharide heptosyltransferase II n=1 Tax=Ktedonosporobacter rubrisoli TaxID=2509675 RepID=A0A4V0Z055_KTERU|nr:lipopolysaccharide heptosyltransferase II [Ktedonosporobacter rubrisoli]QBD82041.1 lipopolysaccharide heptosyltransferase II [Ktedonosporobacter rubrisoli]
MTQITQPDSIDDYGYPSQPTSQRKLRNTVVHGSKHALLTAIYFLLGGYGAYLRLQQGFKHYQPLRAYNFFPRRILVIRLDLIGDLVLSLTVVRALKRTYPDAEIDLLALPSSAKVIAADPDISNVITYDPNIWRRPKALLQPQHWHEAKQLQQRLQARHYDLAVSVFGPWASILALLSGAKRRLGFAQESYPGFLTDKVAGQHWGPQDHQHEVDYCLQLARAAGVEVIPEDRIPRLYVDEQARHEIAQMLKAAGMQEKLPLIACHVSSNNGQSKRWPIPYWATLIDRLMQEDHCNVVLTGAPADIPLIEKITRRLHAHPINLAGKTSLAQLAALLQHADLMITGDSGPMHIAAAVGTPLIAIHGPTDPALSGPVSPQATILRSDIWCSPCYDAKSPADCRFFTTQCMKNITPTQVYSIVCEKLQQDSHRPVEHKESQHS